ncbi:MAG: hypothetical protein E2P02_28880 [Acidobacteria bacterium]|nr:MAG: hypothetical protein E2P02_28880 [Acidobacteriota bacterium]
MRDEIRAMATGFLELRPMQAFEHDIPLSAACRWQDELVGFMQPSLGSIVGYKTGGHDSRPPAPTFHPAWEVFSCLEWSIEAALPFRSTVRDVVS